MKRNARGGGHRLPAWPGADSAPLPAMDLPFLILVLTLVGFGLVMLAVPRQGGGSLYRRGDAFAYLRPAAALRGAGASGLWMASRVDYHIYHKLAWPLLALSLVLLAAVLFMPEYNGCKRWIVLPGLGTLQPSEIAKFSVVLVFTHIISLNHDRMGGFAVGGCFPLRWYWARWRLMLLEPHLSGTVLILGIGAVLMFVGGTGLRWFMLAGGAGWQPSGRQYSSCPNLSPTPPTVSTPGWTPLPTRWATDTRPSKACTPSAPAGRGAGPGQQPSEAPVCARTPERFSFFPSFCEELGFVGACAVMPAVQSAAAAGRHAGGSRAGPLRGTAGGGVVVQVALQAVLNVAVVTNTIPNTGISLPFFSSGGTSLMMLLGEMGIVLSVSRGET